MVVTLSELGWFLKACFLHEEIDSKRLRSVQGQISVHSIVVPEEFSLPTFYHSLMLFHSNSKPEPYVFRKKNVIYTQTHLQWHYCRCLLLVSHIF